MSSSNRGRVKLYSLNENNVWMEMGTGYVTVQHVERLQSLSLTVRSENDGMIVCIMCVCHDSTRCLGSVLLESRIMTERTYQKREVKIIYYNYVLYIMVLLGSHLPLSLKLYTRTCIT